MNVVYNKRPFPIDINDSKKINYISRVCVCFFGIYFDM